MSAAKSANNRHLTEAQQECRPDSGITVTELQTELQCTQLAWLTFAVHERYRRTVDDIKCTGTVINDARTTARHPGHQGRTDIAGRL